MLKKFICLANSRKNTQRCVAGIDEAGKWIRLVLYQSGGALPMFLIQDEQGQVPRLLETWEVAVKKPSPLCFQPENWIIEMGARWKKADLEDCIYPDLDELCKQDEHSILCNNSNKIPEGQLIQEPITQSIIIIFAENVTFQKTTHSNGNSQIRALFSYNYQDYNLPVTDPEWEKQYNNPEIEYGNYPYNEGMYLVIGLGEEYRHYHYKLVVGVITQTMLFNNLDEWDMLEE